MAKNMAVRRAEKAQRRKVIVAQKRKGEQLDSSLEGQARLAAAQPIQRCILSDDLLASGFGMMIVTRGPSARDVTMTTFLLDTAGLGVKDVFLRSMDGHDMQELLEATSAASRMHPVEPSYARKLLHDLVAWSRKQGFNPHPDYIKVEPIFGSVKASDCTETFTFGIGGMPLLVGDLGDIESRLSGTYQGMTIEGVALEDESGETHERRIGNAL